MFIRRFKRICFLMSLVVLTALANCGGGGGVTPKPGDRTRPPSERGIVALRTQLGNLWVLGRVGAVKASSVVEVLVGGQSLQTVAESNGSFSLNVPGALSGTILVTYTNVRGVLSHTNPVRADVLDNLESDFISVGSAPNDMAFAEGEVLVANYFDNTVTIYDRETFELVKTVDFPQGAGPSYVSVRGGNAYVACNGNNTVYALSLREGEEFGEVLFSVQIPAGGSAFPGPSKLYANDERIFVPLNNVEEFVSPGQTTPYLPAEVVVISLATQRIEDRVRLSGFNAIEVLELNPAELLVVEAGALSFDRDFEPFLTSDSLLEILDADTLKINRTVNMATFGLGPALYDPLEKRVFVGSILRGDIGVVDAETWTVEPISLTLSQEKTFVSDIAFLNGILLVSSFNEDKIYAASAEDLKIGIYPLPEPLFIGVDEEGFLAGPQALYVDTDEGILFFLQGLANRMGKYKLP